MVDHFDEAAAALGRVLEELFLTGRTVLPRPPEEDKQ